MNWTDWYLVFNGGQTLLGKWDGDCMSPVYELHTSVKTDAQGRGTGIMRHMSLPNFIDVPFVTWPRDMPNVAIKKLSPGVQRELANGIAMAEEMRTKIRAAESGLVVP